MDSSLTTGELVIYLFSMFSHTIILLKGGKDIDLMEEYERVMSGGNEEENAITIKEITKVLGDLLTFFSMIF